MPVVHFSYNLCVSVFYIIPPLILFEQPKYIQLLALPVDSVFVNQQGQPLNVNVPSLNDLLGDKLTAFAPNTTAIPYTKSGVSRAMEIIKSQLPRKEASTKSV